MGIGILSKNLYKWTFTLPNLTQLSYLVWIYTVTYIQFISDPLWNHRVLVKFKSLRLKTKYQSMEFTDPLYIHSKSTTNHIINLKSWVLFHQLKYFPPSILCHTICLKDIFISQYQQIQSSWCFQHIIIPNQWNHTYCLHSHYIIVVWDRTGTTVFGKCG